MIAWRCAPFAQLTPRELHDIYQARIGVFVLEQRCAFQDVDGADPLCWHLCGSAPGDAGEAQGPLLAYARLVPPGVKYAEPSIGRVLTTALARRNGTGRALMREAIAACEAMWPGSAIRIGAQRYLEAFYGEFGFVRDSEPYDEDGIEHIVMVRRAPGR